MRILVVEDRADIIGYYVAGLDRMNAAYDTAVSRVEAIDRLRRRSYEGAIIDLQLSDDSSYSQGIEVLRYIAQQDEGLRAVVVSGTPNVKDVVDSYEEGAVTFVIKGAGPPLPKVAEGLVQDCENLQLRLYGGLPSLNAYLSDPMSSSDWETLVKEAIGCTYPGLQKVLKSAFAPYAPVLRPINSTVGLKRDQDTKTAIGTFWSKRQGFAVVIGFSNDMEAVRALAPEGAVELEEFHPTGDVCAGSWKLPQVQRDDFPEFLHERPWSKK